MATKSKLLDSILSSVGKPVDAVLPEPGTRIRLSGRRISIPLPSQVIEVALGKERLHVHKEVYGSGKRPPDAPDLIVFNPDCNTARINYALRLSPGQCLHISRDEPNQEHLFRTPREAFRRNFHLDHEGDNLVMRDPTSDPGTYVTLLDLEVEELETAGRRRCAIDKIIDVYGGAVEIMGPEDALATLRRVNALLEDDKFRPRDKSGSPGGLLRLPDDIAPVIVGDLHANVDNLLKILSENAFMQELEAGTAALVFLGDLVQPDTAPYDEMDSSLLMMDILFKLKVRFPDGVFFLRGNHDSFSPEVSKDLVLQAVLWRKTLEEFRGEAYRDEMARFYELSPAVALSNAFVACHAGPPLSKTKLEKIVNLRSHPGLLHDLTWNRIRRPGRPSGYTPGDVKRFRKSLKLSREHPFLVSHTPYSETGTLWCDVAGIENHHILYSSRPQYVSIFIGINGQVAPQVYSAEPMLDWVNRRARERA